nr:hypothetical protein C05G6.1 - Caenorhabditis elegans [Caenorhabditis elegans]
MIQEAEEEDKKEKLDDILFSAATPGSWISSTSTCNEPLPVAPKEIPGENYIETLAALYKNSVERRRMFYCNGSLREMLGGTGLKMRPTRFDERYYKEKMRFELVLYVEMMNSMSVFRQMDLDTKETLVKGCAVSLAMLEKYYISVKYDGLRTQKLIAPDGSYTDLSDHGAQFDDEFTQITESVMDKETCLKLLYDPLRSCLNELGSALEHSRMTDTEFCALFAILLFNTAADNLSDASRNAVVMARNRVMKDWFERFWFVLNVYENQNCLKTPNFKMKLLGNFSKKSYGVSKNGLTFVKIVNLTNLSMSQRLETIFFLKSPSNFKYTIFQAGLLVGNTLLLLTAVRNAMAVHRENFHVIRVFNVMEYDKLIDDLAFT